MTQKDFLEKTIRSLIKSFSSGIFAFIIEAFLTYFTFGCTTVCPWIGGFVGCVIGSFVGNILSSFVVNGVLHLAQKPLPLSE